MFIVKSRKQIFTAALTAFLGISCGALIRFSPEIGVFSLGKSEQLTVVVDPGHGMPDGGAVGVGGVVEQKINLEIAKKAAQVLEGKGFRVILTRDGEEGLSREGSIREMKREDMKKRRKIMEERGVDLFLSIHMNSFPSQSVSGLRMFYADKFPRTKVLAEGIGEGISEITGAKMYPVKPAEKGLFLMKNPPVEAVLAECGFLSNPQEEKKLSDKDYQAKIAWAIADAIEKYYEKGL